MVGEYSVYVECDNCGWYGRVTTTELVCPTCLCGMTVGCSKLKRNGKDGERSQMTLREEIEKIINDNACYDSGCVSKMSTAILQAVEGVVPEKQKSDWQGSDRDTNETNGFNECRSAMLKKIRGEG